MNKNDVTEHIFSEYGVKEEYLWAKFPDYCIFRRSDNQKWFAAFLPNISLEKLGLKSDEKVDLLNLKIDPDYKDFAVLDNKIIFSGWHMNKRHWISIVLAKADEKQVKDLIFHSWQQTGKK